MKSRMTLMVASLLVPAAFAQTLQSKLKSKIIDVHYPPLAEQARIEGDVHLRLNSGVVTVLSGHPLLAGTASESAKSFEPIEAYVNADVTYHFALADMVMKPTPVTVKKGNAFGRAILRMFGLKTEKVVLENHCQETIPPPNDLKAAGATIEIWIYGRTGCLQTQTTNLLARR